MTIKQRIADYLKLLPDAKPSEVAKALHLVPSTVRRTFQELGFSKARKLTRLGWKLKPKSPSKPKPKRTPKPGDLQGERRDIPAKLLKLLVEGMEKRIRASLSDAATKIPGARYVLAVNADSTIDGELAVNVPRGTEVKTVIQDMNALRFISATWVSGGFRFPPAGPDEIGSGIVIGQDGQPRKSKRGKWAYQIQTAYQKAHKTLRFWKVILSIAQSCDEKGYRKPYEVFCRIHWNAYGLKPTREG